MGKDRCDEKDCEVCTDDSPRWDFVHEERYQGEKE